MTNQRCLFNTDIFDFIKWHSGKCPFHTTRDDLIFLLDPDLVLIENFQFTVLYSSGLLFVSISLLSRLVFLTSVFSVSFVKSRVDNLRRLSSLSYFLNFVDDLNRWTFINHGICVRKGPSSSPNKDFLRGNIWRNLHPTLFPPLLLRYHRNRKIDIGM